MIQISMNLIMFSFRCSIDFCLFHLCILLVNLEVVACSLSEVDKARGLERKMYLDTKLKCPDACKV